jgi:hypothetical protein
MSARADTDSQLICLRGNRIVSEPLMKCVEETQSVADAIAAHDFERAMELRGSSLKKPSARCEPCCGRCRTNRSRGRSACGWRS